jgi:hypothetical protein
MHIQDHNSSGELAGLLDTVGGEPLHGSGFEAEQSETDFDSNDFLEPLAVEVRE